MSRSKDNTGGPTVPLSEPHEHESGYYKSQRSIDATAGLALLYGKYSNPHVAPPAIDTIDENGNLVHREILVVDESPQKLVEAVEDSLTRPHDVVIIDSLPQMEEHRLGRGEDPETERGVTTRRNFGNPYGIMAAAALAASITNPFSSHMFSGYDTAGSLRLPVRPSRDKNRKADPEKKAKRKAQGKARAKNRRK